MKTIIVEPKQVYSFVPQAEIEALAQATQNAHLALEEGTGKGNDFLGWVSLPQTISPEDIATINTISQQMKAKIDVMVVIGIGGSYLGAKAVIEALSKSFPSLQKSDFPQVLFAGHQLSEDYLADLIEVLKQKSFAITVISKSGTTTEPAVAFRILKQQLENKYGLTEAATRIIAITDQSKGALRQLANQEGYQTFVIPDDVGGRYSVFTPVGLLPIAIAGFDIEALLAGANIMMQQTHSSVPFNENPASIYAATRFALSKKGYTNEILANYNPKLTFIAEWWKQLYGESEGKEHKGIFPASVNFTTDLHSLGQYIQEGKRNLFETVISVKSPNAEIFVPSDKEDLDGLNYLAGSRIDHVNKMAELGTLIAHVEGGVPNIHIRVPKISENYIGQMLYMFEKACGVSGYLLDVNPFDQPGVEAYKKNMFALLNKPGFEDQHQAIRNKLQ